MLLGHKTTTNKQLEVDNIKAVISRTVIHAFTSMFARHGIPDVLVSDNGPQFAAAEFASFANF